MTYPFQRCKTNPVSERLEGVSWMDYGFLERAHSHFASHLLDLERPSFEVTVVSGKKLITELLANKLLTCALEKGRYRKSVNNLHM